MHDSKINMDAEPDVQNTIRGADCYRKHEMNKKKIYIYIYSLRVSQSKSWVFLLECQFFHN